MRPSARYYCLNVNIHRPMRPSTLSLPISQPVYAACTRCQLSRRLLGESVLRDHLMYSVRRPSPPQLERLRVCTPCPQQFSHSTRPSRSLMEAVGATSAIVGLAIPVFKFAKELRDRIKLVCPLSSSPFAYLHSAHDNSPSVSAGRIGESGTLGSTHRI